MVVGDHVHELDYQGIHGQHLLGFYRTKSANGSVSFNTQFEPVHAREAFPCFDEPAFKATFTVSATVPRHMTALGNMPVASVVTESDQFHTFTFEKTPPISTYLLGLCVGNYESISKTTKAGLPVSVYAPEDEIKGPG